MHKISVIAFCLILIGCNSSEEKPVPKERQAVETNIIPQTLEPFYDSLVRLDKYAPENIEKAVFYFQKLVPSDTTLADSAVVRLLKFVKDNTDNVNQKIGNDTMNLVDLVYQGGNPPTEKQKAFQQNLKKYHLNLQGNGEGDVFAVLDYQWFNNVVQPRTSAATGAYLSLMAAEETEPTLMDAGLTIEVKELVSRVILSERLAAQAMPVPFVEKIKEYNKFYVNVFLLGSDNSPSLADENNMTLVPEFRQGYDYLLAAYPDSKAALKVKEWLEVVKTKNKTKLREMQRSQYQ